LIVLFTDFGLDGPYTGQMKAVLHQMAPGIPIIDLFADAPTGDPKPSAYLLAAYAVWFAAGTVFLCVVIPASADRGQLLFLRPTGDGMLAPATALNCNAQIKETGSGSLKAETASRHASVDRQQALCRANPQDSWQALRQQISGRIERHAD
jgi:S-adenosylmethionine hydroxide adenosyltransferase-like protein